MSISSQLPKDYFSPESSPEPPEPTLQSLQKAVKKIQLQLSQNLVLRPYPTRSPSPEPGQKRWGYTARQRRVLQLDSNEALIDRGELQLRQFIVELITEVDWLVEKVLELEGKERSGKEETEL
ncbi:hypothetical protein EG328_003410 [Venturia inaequalis]|uniref:Uncharacterized protein n=1 Tax=Venturia inaequalis TaxID=5025 RepID=A0A8H3UTT3_VENIN|nr:hypothetical protein EG328_003410 [Venturia inaequalis]